MGIQYFRPKSIEEALELLLRPNTIPLSGGTHLTREAFISKDLVDLQSLGLDKFNVNEEGIEIGATVKLQNLISSKIFPTAFHTAIQLEAPVNIRNSMSVGGLLIKGNGRSPILTSFLSMNASVQIQPGFESINLQEFLNFRVNTKKSFLITSINLQNTRNFSFQYISRTKFDKPIICVALSVLSNGIECLALGGYGKQPMLVNIDPIEKDLPLAARNAFISAEDEWASAEYRTAMAEVLTER